MNRIARIFQRKFQSFSYLHSKLSGPLKLDPKFLQWFLWHPPSMTLLATPMCWMSTAINSQSWKKTITCRVSSLKDWVVQLESQLSFTYIKRVGWCYKYKFAVLSLFLFATWSFPLPICPSSEILSSFTLLSSTRNIASIHKKGCDSKNLSSIWYWKSQSA